MGSALSVKDIAGFHKLSVRSLGAKSLGLGITAVLCGTYTLLMSEELKIKVHHFLHLHENYVNKILVGFFILHIGKPGDQRFQQKLFGYYIG
jgi:hypothetical protein